MRSGNKLPTAAFLGAIAGVFLLGWLSLKHIPFFPDVPMLDFHNVYQFHHCEKALEQGPYMATGEECNDRVGRPFLYPPVLYWTFAWTRLIPKYGVAVVVWRLTLIGLMLVSGRWWVINASKVSKAPDGMRVVMIALWILLLTQFPFVFALERGNTDVIVVAAWTLLSAAVVGERFLLGGLLGGFAVGFKLYPLVSVGILLIGLNGQRPVAIARFVAGFAVGILVPMLFLLEDASTFVASVLPGLVRSDATPPLLFAHSLQSLPVAVGVALGLVLLLPWVVAAHRALFRAPLLVLSGGLAVSTYFGSISYDYNLVTALPLGLLVAGMGLKENGSGVWKVLTLGMFATMLGGRGLVSPTGLLVAQVLVLGAIGIGVAIQADVPAMRSERDTADRD